MGPAALKLTVLIANLKVALTKAEKLITTFLFLKNSLLEKFDSLD